MLGALGVVFGDIGTSPLYALRECFAESHGVYVDRASVLGVLSLIVWTLVLIVCVKYVAIVLRAQHRGEGGILALLSLAFLDPPYPLVNEPVGFKRTMAQLQKLVDLLVRCERHEGPPPKKFGRAEMLNMVGQDLSLNPEAVEPVIRAVFAAIQAQISEGESEDVMRQLPHDIRDLWQRAV